MKLLNFWRRPFFWLLVQAFLVFFALLSSDSLKPEMVSDSASYRDAALAPSVAAALISHRTGGYPLFFKLAGLRKEARVDGRHKRHVVLVTRRLPKIHAAVYLAAVLLFWYAVRVYTGAPWLAFAATLPLVYSGLWSIVQRIQPDFLAAALALASVSLLILLAARPGGKLLWASLAVAVPLTYQVRPAYLFLVALAPVLGALLWLAREPARPRRALLLGLGLLGTMLVPYLLFCAVRWSIVGHFGLVSFGGFNVVGITASFLDGDLVRELPRRQQGFARRILRLRQASEMKPYKLLGDGVAYHAQYNSNVWDIAVPEAYRTARFAAQSGGPAAAEPTRALGIEVNESLAELSRNIIRNRPFLYAKWVWDSFVVCLEMGARAVLDSLAGDPPGAFMAARDAPGKGHRLTLRSRLGRPVEGHPSPGPGGAGGGFLRRSRGTRDHGLSATRALRARHAVAPPERSLRSALRALEGDPCRRRGTVPPLATIGPVTEGLRG